MTHVVLDLDDLRDLYPSRFCDDSADDEIPLDDLGDDDVELEDAESTTDDEDSEDFEP